MNLPQAKLIDESAFQNCRNLQEISAECAKLIGLECFKGCRKLKNIKLPSIKQIGFDAFKQCFKLELNEILNAMSQPQE